MRKWSTSLKSVHKVAKCSGLKAVVVDSENPLFWALATGQIGLFGRLLCWSDVRSGPAQTGAGTGSTSDLVTKPCAKIGSSRC